MGPVATPSYVDFYKWTKDQRWKGMAMASAKRLKK
jgi:hypothetical protein